MMAAAAEPGQLRPFPNSGAIAGVYARTDQQGGVWKAPAGTAAVIKGADDLECHLNDREQDTINAWGLNALGTFVGVGNVVWGARTLAGSDSLGSDWKYVPVRRTALFIEESVYRGLKWAVFEPNAEPLWAEVRKSVEAFMLALFWQGALKGVKADEAFFVRCDAATVTQDDINQGILKVLVGFAPLRPAEFVIIGISVRMAG
jgi:phage tail sheath protein FI